MYSKTKHLCSSYLVRELLYIIFTSFFQWIAKSIAKWKVWRIKQYLFSLLVPILIKKTITFVQICFSFFIPPFSTFPLFYQEIYFFSTLWCTLFHTFWVMFLQNKNVQYKPFLWAFIEDFASYYMKENERMYLYVCSNL